MSFSNYLLHKFLPYYFLLLYLNFICNVAND
nr:MAG TPA: hypothetical protein [Caudoviricetes sp.]